MTREQAIAIVDKHKYGTWKHWLKPWAIQEDVFKLFDYIVQESLREELNNSVSADPEVVDGLRRQLEQKDKALKSVQSWILTTFGPNAMLGPPRDLLMDRFTISTTPK